jgi:hypothetical protein
MNGQNHDQFPNSRQSKKFTIFGDLQKFNLMKSIITLCALVFSLTAFAQDTVMVFKSSNVNLKLRGENIQKTTDAPTTITVDFKAKQLVIETTMPEIKELFRNQMTQPITATMGEMGEEFSLTIDKNIFAHFYLDDRKMIMFTRNDIHPLKWGLMLKEVKEGVN